MESVACEEPVAVVQDAGGPGVGCVWRRIGGRGLCVPVFIKDCR